MIVIIIFKFYPSATLDRLGFYCRSIVYPLLYRFNTVEITTLNRLYCF